MYSNWLILCEFRLVDAPFLFELNNDLEVIKYTGDKPFESLLEAEKFIDSYTHYK